MSNNENEIKIQENGLTDKEIESVVETAKEAIPEGVIDMRELKETVEVDPEAEIVSAHTEIDAIAREVEEFDPESYEEAKESANTKMVEDFKKMNNQIDMTDEEIMQFMDTLNKYSEDESYPLYKNLPAPIQKVIRDLAVQNGIVASEWNKLSRVVMDEFLNTSGVDEALVDLQEALDEALKIPSVMDMYTEHTRNVMENIIPQTIENIKDEYPEKANQLREIQRVFRESYDFSVAKADYESKSTVRKAVRKHDSEFKRVLNDFNFKNEKSNFKMNDIFEVPKVLISVLIDLPVSAYEMHTQDETLDKLPEEYKKILDLGISETDIQKFTIMICKSAENRDPRDVVDASYMYYMMRNIIALQYTNEAKTEFAAELINNICDAIVFIRNKEAEFYEQNSKSKKRNKSGK